MICVQINGGLGNQMFQYAFGRALAYKFQTELLLDTAPLNNNNLGITYRSLELSIFNIKIHIASDKDVKRLKTLFYRIINVISFKLGFQGIQTSKYFVEKTFSYNDSITKISKECYLNGYWQSFKYFQNINSIIRDEFKFQQLIDKRNLDWAMNIKKENSISIHIRRSDFVNNKNHDIHGTCSIEYFQSAVEYIADKVSNPSFFVFSDDINWAKENLKLPYQMTFISGNKGDKSYIDMQLMSLCKHNIIANSSFSWWGAWLNENQDKVVIAPKKWFSDKKMNEQTNDLIPETWVRL